MKRKKVFSFLAASTVALSSMVFPVGQAQAQIPGLSQIPGLGGSITRGVTDLITGRTTPLGAATRFLPSGVGTYIEHGIVMATGRESLLEGITGIVGASVGGPAGSILSYVNTGVGAVRQARENAVLTYGEQDQRTWQMRNAQGQTESIEAKEWKLSYTDGEAKFVLVLMDGQEREYPIEGLYHEDDLKYLCRYLLSKLDELGGKNSVPDTENILSGDIAKMTGRLNSITERIDSISSNQKDKAKEELLVFFRYLNDELCAVSVGLITIEPGTEPGQIKTLRIRGENWTFRWCPAGQFTRQAVIGQKTTEKEQTVRGRNGRSTPRKTTVTENVKGVQNVELSQGFWILDSEITDQMYYRVTLERYTGSPQTLNRPLSGITWENAETFCSNLSKITNHRFALPTEAQWQYACLAGSGETDLNAVAWYKGNSFNGRRQSALHNVKTKEPNAWGIYDMQGNVSEWCADWDGAETPAETAVDPIGPATGAKRVVCGGNYTSPAENCSFDYAVGQLPNSKFGTIGFRVILFPETPLDNTGTASGRNGAIPAVNVSLSNNPMPVSGNLTTNADPETETLTTDTADEEKNFAELTPGNENSPAVPQENPVNENLRGFEPVGENAAGENGVTATENSADTQTNTNTIAGSETQNETVGTDEGAVTGDTDSKNIGRATSTVQLKKVPTQTQKVPSQTQKVPKQTQKVPPQVQKVPTQTQKVPTQIQKVPKQAQKVSPQTQKRPTQVQKVPTQTQKASRRIQKN